MSGEIDASLKHKRLAIDQLLRRLNADTLRLQPLIGWRWIQDALAQLADIGS
jgi:hypothetical protein